MCVWVCVGVWVGECVCAGVCVLGAEGVPSSHLNRSREQQGGGSSIIDTSPLIASTRDSVRALMHCGDG